jgi:DNA ligase-1
MNTIEILEKLESDNSRLFKEALLHEHKDNEVLRRFLVMSADPWKNWGVSKYDKLDFFGSHGHEDAMLHSFMDLLDLLNDRKMTGNKARGAVEGSISAFDQMGQKWAERLLWRNLRCGVSASTINKIWPGSVVPFAVALAETLTTTGVNGDFKITDPVKYPVRVEAKLDGLRCIAVKHNGEVSMFTRSGTPIDTLPRIKAAIEALPADNFVFDGEAMGEDWNESASVVMSSKTKKDDSGMRYHVFDYIPFAEWQDQKSDVPYSRRLLSLHHTLGNGLATAVAEGKSGIPFHFVKSKTCDNETELREFYAECLNEGYEGVMLKDTTAPYRWKRSDAILKLKPVATEEGVVVGWHLSPERTKRAGLFGGFIVLTPNGVTTKVGGGYTDALKQKIQDEGPASYVGRIIECEHQPPFTGDGKMRFPVFTRFRDPSDVDSKVLAAFDTWKSAGNDVKVIT